jgi:hypothetical protein
MEHMALLLGGVDGMSGADRGSVAHLIDSTKIPRIPIDYTMPV